MKKLFKALFHPVVLAVIGLLALAAVIWWVGPLIAIAEWHPLQAAWVRLTLILLIVLVIAGRIAWKKWQERRAHAALVDGMAQAAAAQPSAGDREVQVLGERFTQALGTLKASRGGSSLLRRGQYLYELPWYVFIGAPGSGKTTALLNAGLNFPLAEQLGQAAVKGVGGTRNCDWWFTDEAVLVDTAGRYTTQQSDAATDAAAWDGFLALLKKHRPRRPINGVLLTVNVQDILQQGPGERQQHAAKLRARVQELQAKLGVRMPVYVLVTKTDLLAGFNESFEALGKEERDQVWGFTLPLADAKNPAAAQPLARFDDEFVALETRLRDALIDRMQAERDVLKRAAIFAFPQQFASVRGVLGDFLKQVFGGEGRFEEQPLLRGVYFTSGTQEGTPIDRVLGTLARAFGVERRPTAATGTRGKSFFLHRLLREVVFAEQGLAGANRAAEARLRRLRVASLATIGVVSVLLLAGWSLSWFRNAAYVAEIEAKLPALKEAVSTVPPSSTGDVSPLPAVLSLVRQAAQPGGFAVDDPPLLNTLGLYQGEKLDAAAQQAYGRLLDHAFMPRVARRQEERLRSASRDNLEFAYEALKHYLMLYTPDQYDADSLAAWVSLDWDANLRNLSAEQRAALDADLAEAVKRGAPQGLPMLDQQLVSNVRDMLAAFPLEYRVYSRLKRIHLDGEAPEFTVAQAAGPQAAQVFQRASGDPLTKGVPGLYTRDGYYKGFNKSVTQAATLLAAEESWVLGTRIDPAQLKDAALGSRVTDAVRQLYLQDYIKTWDAYLADVQLVKLDGLSRSVQIARVLAATDSPLARYMRAVGQQVGLAKNAPQAGKTLGDKLDQKADAAKREIAALVGSVDPAPEVQQGPAKIEQQVDDHFAEILRLVEGQPAPIDDIVKKFNDVYVQLAAVEAAQKSKAPPPPGDAAERAKADAGLQPEPIRSMLTSLASAGAEQSRAAERQNLTDELRPITEFCNRTISGRYPVASGAQADVLPDDFGQVFGQGGMLDDFYNRRLASLVDTGKATWTFRPLADGTRPPGGAALADFQRAARIREVFFRNGGKAPTFRVDIRAIEFGDGLQQMTMDIDGQPFKFKAGDTTPQTINWPSQRVASQVRLTVTPGAGSGVVFSGPWALFRMFDRYGIQPSDRPERFTVIANVDGKRVRLEVTSSSAFNPFSLRELRQFRCPGSL